MSVTLRRFRETDIRDIDPRFDATSSSQNAMMFAAANGVTFTFVEDGVPIAIVGANPLWTGVAQVWSIMSPAVKRHGVFITKAIREILRIGAKVYQIRRYHGIVHASIQENIRWFQLLEFEYEYTMYKAAPDESDIYGFVRWEVNHGRKPKHASSELRATVEQLFGLASRSNLAV